MTDKPVTTAVITAAGHATRMWPSSKAVPKELFPLGKVPAIVYLLWEMADAGISNFVLVVGPATRELIRTLLDSSIQPPPNVSNDPLVGRFQAMLSQCQFTIIEQRGQYGNGTPLLLAAEVIARQPCIYAFGDDVVLGENVTQGLIRTFNLTGCPVLAAQRVDSYRRSQFGILECREQEGIRYVSRLIEKPSPGETASDLASLGRYLVTPDVVDMLRRTPPGRNNEVWFADSVIQRIGDGAPVCAFMLTTGKWYTVGDPVSYAEAVAAATHAPVK